jgi:hypothetical protein
MATFNSNAITRKLPVPGFGAGGGQLRTQQTTVALTVGATTTDNIQLFDLPPNAKVLGILVKYPAFGGATTLNIGDAGYGSVAADADRYFAAGSVATAGTSVALAATGAFFSTGPRKLRITAAFAAGTVATAGDLSVAITYTVEEPQA